MRRRKKSDMYIDYRKSYRRRGRNRNSTLIGIITVLILATVFGIGTYYAIRIKAGGEYRLNKNRDISDNSEENADDPNIIPTPQVTVAPTVEPEVEQIIEEVDPRVPVRARGIYVTSRAIMDRRTS